MYKYIYNMILNCIINKDQRVKYTILISHHKFNKKKLTEN